MTGFASSAPAPPAWAPWRSSSGEGIAFDCFEQSERVGGHWHTDYESLHLITSRDLSGFAGHPMPSHYPVYPSRDQMRDYLERFASETGVRAHVRFGVRVERITPLGTAGRDGWRVETSDGDAREYTGVRRLQRPPVEPNLPAIRASSPAGRSTRARIARSRTSRARGC